MGPVHTRSATLRVEVIIVVSRVCASGKAPALMLASFDAVRDMDGDGDGDKDGDGDGARI